MKHFLLAVLLPFALLADGCITEKSIRNASVEPYLGSRFRTTRPFFLTKEGDSYTLRGERQKDIPVTQAPTFDEFRQGHWRNRAFLTVKYLAIVPRGSVIEITDIVRRDHIETGITYTCYGRLLGDEELEKYDHVDLFFLFPDRLHPSKMRGGERIP